MRIITTADDFGYDDDTVDATIAAVDQGVVTCTSIMTNMPAARRALDYAKRQTAACFGVHLVYCSDGIERPVLPPAAIPALVDERGLFLPSNRLRALGLLGKLPVDQIARETEAQLSLARDFGVAIRYVDAHGHLHKLPQIQQALAQVLPRFGISRVRRAQDVYLSGRWKRPMSYFHTVMNRRLGRRFTTTDYFYMPDGGGRNWPARLLDRIGNLRGTLEVGVHPGANDAWRRDEAASIRSFVKDALAAGHRLSSWAEIKVAG